MGELLVGPVLGMGSQGDMGTDRVALLYHHAPWTAGRMVDAIWISRGQCVLLSGSANGVVWRQLRSRQGLAQLRLRDRRRDLCRYVCRVGSAVCLVCDLAV